MSPRKKFLDQVLSATEDTQKQIAEIRSETSEIKKIIFENASGQRVDAEMESRLTALEVRLPVVQNHLDQLSAFMNSEMSRTDGNLDVLQKNVEIRERNAHHARKQHVDFFIRLSFHTPPP